MTQRALAAGVVHAVQGRHVLIVFDDVAGALENLLHGVDGQGVQPQFLDLLELTRVGKGGVVLVVIIQPEQGKYLVDRLDQLIRWRGGLTWPRRCR